MKLIQFLSILFMIQSANADVINLNAVPNNQSCQANYTCYLGGTHDIEIINNSESDHAYAYMYLLCMEGLCNEKEGQVTVKAHTRFNSHYVNTLPRKMPRGSSNLICSTEITGYENKTARNYSVIMAY